MRAAWAIARALGGIWGELKEVKELLGVIAYKKEDDQDVSESEESEGATDDGVVGLQEENERVKGEKRRGKGRKLWKRTTSPIRRNRRSHRRKVRTGKRVWRWIASNGLIRNCSS